MSAPAFAGLVRSALALFRVDTAAIAKWIPQAFDLRYRDYGRFAIEAVGPTHVNVTLSELPDELNRHRYWQGSVESGLHALFFLTGVQGSTALLVTPTQRTMRVALRWH